MKVRCPTCRKAARVSDKAPHRPFCSDRCKAIDLANWLDETYRISRPVAVDAMADDEFVLD